MNAPVNLQAFTLVFPVLLRFPFEAVLVRTQEPTEDSCEVAATISSLRLLQINKMKRESSVKSGGQTWRVSTFLTDVLCEIHELSYGTAPSQSVTRSKLLPTAFNASV